MTYHVLSVGPVPELLTTRNAVLRRAGFEVQTSLDLNEALGLFLNGDFDTALLCHAIPARDKERFVRLLKDHKPLTPVVVMTDGNGSSYIPADLEIHNLDGPEELLRQIAEAIAGSSRPQRRTK